MAAEVDALIGPGSVEAPDFEAFEEALRPLRGLLGATSREGRLMPSNNDVVHPPTGLRLTSTGKHQ